MLGHIATVAVYVVDQEKALKFWTEKLGFEVRANHKMTPDASWIEVGSQNGQTHIVIYPRSMMPNWKEMKPSIVFFCDDVEKTFEELSMKGVEFTEDPKEMDWGTYAKFRDPDGNEFLIKSVTL